MRPTPTTLLAFTLVLGACTWTTISPPEVTAVDGAASPQGSLDGSVDTNVDGSRAPLPESGGQTSGELDAGSDTHLDALEPNDATAEVDQGSPDAADGAPPPPPTPSVVLRAGPLGGDGTADDTGERARFYQPMGVAVDGAGIVFVADRSNHSIRRIAPGGVVTTFVGTAGYPGRADGRGTAAAFVAPVGLAFDAAGNLLIADSLNHAIRKVTPSGDVTTFAGKLGVAGQADGPALDARFNEPYGIAIDAAGNVLVADSHNHTVRTIATDLTVTTLAGAAGISGSTDGTGSDARFDEPTGIAVTRSGTIVVTDSNNAIVRTITPSGVVTTLAGTAGALGTSNGDGGASARFARPRGVIVDGNGNYLVADSYGGTIRQITPAGGVSTFVSLTGWDAVPWALSLDASGNLFVADMNDTVLSVSPGGVVERLAGAPPQFGTTDGPALSARFRTPWGAAVDASGNVFIADYSNHTIRKLTPTGVVSTVAGKSGYPGAYVDGASADARLSAPVGVAVDAAGNLFVTEPGAHTIRRVDTTGAVTTISGSPGAAGSLDANGANARWNYPAGIAVDAASNLYVADSGNHTIRKIAPNGDVTTLAGTSGASGFADGTGTSASFSYPQGVAVDVSGNLFVTSTLSCTIRKITAAGVVSTLAGIPLSYGSKDGPQGVATFRFPEAIAVDPAGNVFVADTGNSTIRMISPSGDVTTPAGVPRQSGVLTGPLPGRLNGGRGLAITPAGSLIVTSMEHSVLEVFLP